MKSMIKMRADPACPRRWSATAGGTNPEPASPELIGSMRAVEASPSEVAREKGIANLFCRRESSELRLAILETKRGLSYQQIPPSKYPLAALDGRAAIALCQYDWSTKTVPKFPMMLIILMGPGERRNGRGSGTKKNTRSPEHESAAGDHREVRPLDVS